MPRAATPEEIRRAALVDRVETAVTNALYNPSTESLPFERHVVFALLMGALQQGPYARWVEGIEDVHVQGVLVDGRPLYVVHELLFSPRWQLAGVLLDSIIDVLAPKMIAPLDVFAAYELMDEAIEVFAATVAGERS